VLVANNIADVEAGAVKSTNPNASKEITMRRKTSGSNRREFIETRLI
jgi:hypothetical protein